jgi:ribose transport system ATP-binding protein
LEIRRGQVVALYGVVGCGAERVVGALAGQGSPGRLEFTLAGRPYRPSNATQALQQGVAYLPSGRAANCIFPGRSIAENLTISNLRRFGRFGVVSASAEKAHAQSALKAAAVKFANADLPITSLSGGNQQKVLLARALSAARELLILEEPTAGVDIDAKAQIHARIREAVSNGLAVLMLSCDLEETIALSDVVLTMYRDGIVGSYEMPTAADQPAIVADVLGQNCPAASQELTESTSYVDRTPPSSPCTYEKAVRMAPPPW